jgi:putative ABC transport system permease protein
MFTNTMTGYISWDTLGSLGFPKRYTQLDIKTSPEIETLEQAEKFTFDLTETLKRRGIEVNYTIVFKPNQHWATDNSKAFTAILSLIGVMSLVMSGFLVINTISALLAQQKKQVGVMKAIGANQKQIITLYLMMVGVYGLLALAIALPLGMALGYVFLKMIAGFLNLDINVFFLPTSVFLMELAAALIIPIVAAIVPIIQGTKKSVREVISDYQPSTKVSRSDKILSRITGFSRPVLISLRNTFRKKARLALTLGTLVTAGALFIAVINVRTGMFREMDRILQMFDFEVSVNLPEDHQAESIVTRLKDVSKVQAVEARTNVQAKRIKEDGTKGKQFVITGLPPDTVFSHPVLLSGRWLNSGDKDRVVLTSAFVRDNPDIKVGDSLNVEVGSNDKETLEIVGVIAMTAGQGESVLTFSDFNTVARLKDKPNMASGYLVKTTPNDATTQDEVAREIENKLDRSGISIAGKTTKDQIYSAAANQFNFLIFFLLAMAVMVAIVGGLGLAGTMSLNVLERTREIGIMRSIGANDGTIRRIVVIEGLLVGFISFVLALPLSLVLTLVFCIAIGNAFFERTLVFAVVPGGMLIWLLVVTVIATVASIVPARRASKLSINETLSYE